MTTSKNFDVESLFLSNMHFLKKKLFGTDEAMSTKLGIRKSTLNDKLNRKSSFDLSEIEQIGQRLGIHPGLLLYFNLSDHFEDLSKIESLLELMNIPVIHLQIMSRFEEVKRTFREDIINFQTQRRDNEEREVNFKATG